MFIYYIMANLKDCSKFNIHEDFYTRKKTWEQITPFIDKDLTIYEFCLLNSNEQSKKYFQELGYNVIGNRTRIKVVKNKVAPPFREIEFDIMYGTGISKEGDVLDLAVKENIVDKAGSWYSYNNAKIGQGRENSKVFLSQNLEIMEEIKNKVLIKHGLLTDPDAMNAVNMETGELVEEVVVAAELEATSKKAKKSKKIQ